MAADGTAVASKTFEKVEDKSVYWTTSFYIAAPRMPRSLLKAIRARDTLRQIRDRHEPSRKLSEAIEPLFNDISDRERAGKVDDFLFSVAVEKSESFIELSMPPSITWVTEGLRTTASPPDPLPPQTVRVRRFWYVHRDGAVSWHVSFLLDYSPPGDVKAKIQEARDNGEDPEDVWHKPALLYFLSQLQKVLAPKEFARADEQRIAKSLRIHKPPPEGTGIAVIDKTRVRMQTRATDDAPLVPEAGEGRTFWQQLAQWFNGDVGDLFDRIQPKWRDELKAASKDRHARVMADPFDALVGVEPFLEIPELRMPRFRYMFFFVDETFFNRLLPPLDPETGRPMARALLVKENCYTPYLKAIDEKSETDGDGNAILNLDAAYWKWVLERDDLPKALAQRRQKLGPKFDEWLDAYRKATPAWKDDRRPDCLNYLFLSGFNQNIIDFMAQDASEVLDSLDPIYPDSDDDSGERFFIRYANPRGFITYVRASRSLEAGNDYIGTCPYAFLIHVLALHNEYLARDYEKLTETMIGQVETLNNGGDSSEAVERFYRFRTGEFSDYARHRYGSVFRYDTEAKVFSEMEQRRGIERKTAYLTVILENLEKQTSDLQARLQKREDRQVTYAVGAVGAFGLFSLFFDIIGAIDALQDGRTLQDGFVWISVLVSGAIAFGIVIAVAYFIVRDVMEDGRNERAQKKAALVAQNEWVDQDP